MFRTVLFLFVPLIWLNTAQAEMVADATGRQINVPDHIAHVLPAGPPAAVLLAAIAPGESMGFTGALSPQAKAALPEPVASTPKLPRLTGGQDLGPLHPDLIVDYGTVSPRYIDLAKDTQAKSGIPTLLFDGSLDHIPEVARTLGHILHHDGRGEAVARMAEAILALPNHAKTHSVYYARGADGLLAAAPGKDITTVFSLLGWKVLAPAEGGTFRTTTVAEIATFDPDYIILSDPAARNVLTSPAWAELRAVREGHVMVAPSVPFGWIEEPPSINRLLGLAWLKGADPDTLAALFNASVYGRALTSQQVSDMTQSIVQIP